MAHAKTAPAAGDDGGFQIAPHDGLEQKKDNQSGTEIQSITLSPRLITCQEIEFDLSARYLINNLPVPGELSVVYGMPGCAKTFFILTLVLHVALGQRWMGRRVKKTPVLYIAGEGAGGLAKRVEAFRRERGVVREDPVPFNVWPAAFNLLDGGCLDRLIVETKRCEAGLVVVDTLARAMPGGNENAPEDMGRLIAQCDRIRAETGAHIVLIHHTPKTSETPRGHSSLLGAVDTAIHLKKSRGVITAHVEKQKDGADGELCAFELKVIDLGTDADGDPVTSCVIQEVDAPAPQARVTGQAKTALYALRSLLRSKTAQAAP